MIVEINGIIAERLKERDIELVRQWRNSDNIRKNMLYQEIITPEQQKEWFHTINNFNNFYFIVHHKNEKVGLVNIKEIDWKERSGEAGIFMIKRDLTASLLPLVGAVSLSELVVDVFGMKKLYAKVRKNNKTMRKLNQIFGYKMVSGYEDKEYDLFYITADSFNKSAKKWILLINSMGFDTGKMRIILEPEDYLNDFGEKMENDLFPPCMNCLRVLPS